MSESKLTIRMSRALADIDFGDDLGGTHDVIVSIPEDDLTTESFRSVLKVLALGMFSEGQVGFIFNDNGVVEVDENGDCQNCGRQADGEDLFCSGCGMSLKDHGATFTRSADKRTNP